jgi:hypothetical protein
VAKTNTTPDDELLNSIGGSTTPVGDDDFDDLLGQVEEDDSEGWVPSEKGEYVSGVVVKVGEQRSDFAKPGENPMVPAITVEGVAGTPNGEKTQGKWRVIAYGAVLLREIEDADPQVGDRMAVKYFGEKPIKKGPFAGKNYKHYGVGVSRKEA